MSLNGNLSTRRFFLETLLFLLINGFLLPKSVQIAITEELKLSERTYYCDDCGFSIDRDLNAAINIERKGLRVLAY